MLKSIDIFCDVIDNFGDIGFVYRLAKTIKKYNNKIITRVFLNDLESFFKINKKIDVSKKMQISRNIEYYDLRKMNDEDYRKIGTAQVAIEAYACEIPEEYLKNIDEELKIIINLEYLTAEEWAKEYHLNSAYTNIKGVKKYFYMPGFENWSGGLIIDKPDLNKDRKKFFEGFIKEYYVDKKIILNDIDNENIIGTIFSYEYNFENLLKTLNKENKKVILFVFGDKSKKGFEIINNLESFKNIEIIFLDYIDQEKYDQVLYYSDFNFVRGEESFARSMVLGKPFLWQAYCQENNEHDKKVNGFLFFVKKFFLEKEFESFLKIMYNYNSRKQNNYDLSREDFSSFFSSLEELRLRFSETSEYIKKNKDLVENLINFLEEKLI